MDDNNGRYVYCILEGTKTQSLGDIGLFDNKVYTIAHRDIEAVISKAPFKQMNPDANNITAHQRVVEASRNVGTTLPIRFGIMFKSDDGVKQLLKKSYKDFKSKINRLGGKDEFGLKILIDRSEIKKIGLLVQNNSDEIKKLKKELVTAERGASYFLKMRMDEAIKNETLRRIDQFSGEIHAELSKIAEESCLLKADLQQILLNAAYLINKNERERFNLKLEKLEERYKDHGLIFHRSGPWAPYSFC
jgi:hypothetical protein